VIFSAGHSSLSADDFRALLTGAAVATLWDIRSYPSSRWPWFARAELERSLAAVGVRYRWEKALGGRRRPPARPAAVPPAQNAAPTLFPPAPHTAPRWESEGFENYMWHTASAEFLAAAGELLLAGRRTDLAIMCAEALWWRCHRSMIADFVVYAGAEVVHLQPERTPHSAVSGERLGRYAPEVLAAWDRHLAGGAHARAGFRGT